MTAALIGYSSVFMRYSTAIAPVNYLLFGCHLVNFSAQSVQGYRWLNYWKYVFPATVMRRRREKRRETEETPLTQLL